MPRYAFFIQNHNDRDKQYVETLELEDDKEADKQADLNYECDCDCEEDEEGECFEPECDCSSWWELVPEGHVWVKSHGDFKPIEEVEKNYYRSLNDTISRYDYLIKDAHETIAKNLKRIEDYTNMKKDFIEKVRPFDLTKYK